MNCEKELGEYAVATGSGQEKFESTEPIQIANEYNMAIYKRIIATEAANKKREKTKAKIILLIVAIVAVFIVKGIRDAAYHGEFRNFATEKMDDSFTNVYADVLSIEPEYFVYSYQTTRSGTAIGNGNLKKVVCKCKTVEGKTIWATFFYQYYPGGNYSENEEDYKSFKYSTDSPMRILGSVDTAHHVADGLESAIGDIFVLYVKKTFRE